MINKCPVCDSDITSEHDICPVCGFHLMGQTQKFSPVRFDGVTPHVENSANESTKTAYILVLSGITKGSKYDLKTDATETVLGRDPKSTIFLNDMTVSRNHASILFEQGEWIIRDNGSFNGVWVNNKNINTKVLQSGDIIQLGNFSLEFKSQVK